MQPRRPSISNSQPGLPHAYQVPVNPELEGQPAPAAVDNNDDWADFRLAPAAPPAQADIHQPAPANVVNEDIIALNRSVAVDLYDIFSRSNRRIAKGFAISGGAMALGQLVLTFAFYLMIQDLTQEEFADVNRNGYDKQSMIFSIIVSLTMILAANFSVSQSIQRSRSASFPLNRVERRELEFLMDVDNPNNTTVITAMNFLAKEHINITIDVQGRFYAFYIHEIIKTLQDAVEANGVNKSAVLATLSLGGLTLLVSLLAYQYDNKSLFSPTLLIGNLLLDSTVMGGLINTFLRIRTNRSLDETRLSIINSILPEAADDKTAQSTLFALKNATLRPFTRETQRQIKLFARQAQAAQAQLVAAPAEVIEMAPQARR